MLFLHFYDVVKCSSKIGISQCDSMTFEEANGLKGNANYIPKYITEGNGKWVVNPEYAEDNKKYHINCQSCVVANELRRRGYDVTAKPNLKVEGNIPYELSHKTEWVWIDPETGNTPKKSIYGLKVNNRGSITAKPYKETMHDIMEATKGVGRYHIDFTWKGRNDGHIITFERLSNGGIKWYDPQTGDTDFFDKKILRQNKSIKRYKSAACR